MGRYCRKHIINLFWNRSISSQQMRACYYPTPRCQVCEHLISSCLLYSPCKGCNALVCSLSSGLPNPTLDIPVACLEISLSPVKRTKKKKKKVCGETGTHVFLRPQVRHMQPGAGCCCKHPFATHLTSPCRLSSFFALKMEG